MEKKEDRKGKKINRPTNYQPLAQSSARPKGLRGHTHFLDQLERPVKGTRLIIYLITTIFGQWKFPLSRKRIG